MDTSLAQEYSCARQVQSVTTGDLTQNTTETATRTSPNKRFNEQNNSFACVVIILGTLPCRRVLATLSIMSGMLLMEDSALFIMFVKNV